MDDQNDFADPDLEQARADLFDGLETSRVIVQQSRVLLELSESEGLAVGDYDLTED